MQNKYSIFPIKFVREALFTIDKLSEIPKDKTQNFSFIKEILEDKFFEEALFLSSPQLFNEVKKAIHNKNLSNSLKNSVLKYYIRSISNTTPFGLFTTYRLENVESSEGNIPTHRKEYERYSNIDTEYLYELLFTLNKNKKIRDLVYYRNNDTIYKVGKNYRYVDSNLVNTKLLYFLSSIDIDAVIEMIIKSNQQKSMKRSELIDLVIQNVDGIDVQQSEIFIDELIDCNLLLSSLYIPLNEITPLLQVISFFDENYLQIKEDEYLYDVYSRLKKIYEKLQNIDEKVFNKPDVYKNIFEELDHMGIVYNQQYVINSNLKKNRQNDQHNYTFKNSDILKAISTLDILSGSNKHHRNTNLEGFKNRFYGRYEGREVPLLEVMDNDIGIGYLEKNYSNSFFSDLIDNIDGNEKSVDSKSTENEREIFNFWNQLIIENRGNKVIDLEKTKYSGIYSDLKKSESFGTFTLSCNKVGEKILVKHVGGTSGTNLLSRFSANDDQVAKLISNIVNVEKEKFHSTHIAEIFHLPNVRATNLLIRNVNRDHEITILTSTDNEQKNIALRDIVVSIINDKIILKSRVTNKEIIPFLSSAQNFHYDSLNIYQFLCDIQSQYRNHNYSINFGGLYLNTFIYIPRICMGNNVILMPATWYLNKSNILIDEVSDKVDHEAFQKYKKKWNIHRYVFIHEFSEDKLLIDTENNNTLELLINEINLKNIVVVRECLYDVSQPVNISENLLIIENKNVYHPPAYRKQIPKVTKRKFIPGEEWLFIKLYTGVTIANKIIINLFPKVQKLLSNNLIEKWFFIRYNDPDFHLRLRIKVTNVNNLDDVIKQLKQLTSPYCTDGLIWKIDFSTYVRELERYNGSNIENAESLFFYDSTFTYKILILLEKKNILSKAWLYTLRAIDDYFNICNIDISKRHTIVLFLYNGFGREFNVSKNTKSQIGKRYLEELVNIKQVIENPPAVFLKLYDERKKNMVFIKDAMNDDLLSSYIHMTINRFIMSNPRFHELVIYSFLEKYYRGVIGQSKYKL